MGADRSIAVVDLVAMAKVALAEVDRTRPPDACIVHHHRIAEAIGVVADQGPGARFNEIMDAVEAAAGPCPCERCTGADKE